MQLRIGLFAVISIISILVGILPAKAWIQPAFTLSGYYFILSAFFLWCVLFFKQYGRRLPAILKEHSLGLLLAVFLVILIFIQAPPRFKMLADETNLVGVSMSMNRDQTVAMPLSGFHLDYDYARYQFSIDKRPLFFPLLISIVHAILGYSAFNGFVVNFLVSIGLLFLFYLFITQFFSKFYAWLSILLFASLPNFVIWCTSSGFEALNTLLLVSTFLTFHQFLKRREADRAELLFLTLILLANCRYESIIMTIIIVCFVPFIITKKMIKQFSPITYMAPLFFIPILWQRVLFTGAPAIIKENATLVYSENYFKLFEFQNLWSNLNKNIYVMLGLDPNYGFSVLVALLALLGLYLGSKHYLLDLKKQKPEIRYLAVLGFTSAIAQTIIIFAYFWGNFLRADMNRIAFVFIPYIVFFAVYALHAIATYNLKISKPFYTCLCIFHLIYMWPYGFAQHLANTMELPYEYNKVLPYLSSQFINDTIAVVSDRPNLYIIHDYSSVDFAYLNNHADMLMSELDVSLDHVIVLQRYMHGTDAPAPHNRLTSNLQMKWIKTIKGSARTYIKIFEIIGI